MTEHQMAMVKAARVKSTRLSRRASRAATEQHFATLLDKEKKALRMYRRMRSCLNKIALKERCQ